MLKRGTAKAQSPADRGRARPAALETRDRRQRDDRSPPQDRVTRGQLADVLRAHRGSPARARPFPRPNSRQLKREIAASLEESQDRSRQHGAASARAARQSLSEGRRALPAHARRGARAIQPREARRRRAFHAQFTGGNSADSRSSATSMPTPSRRCLPSSSGPGRAEMPVHARARSAGREARAHADAAKRPTRRTPPCWASLRSRSTT